MEQKDYYKILELSDDDRKLQGEDFLKKLKANYRNLAKKFHPDKFANKSESERAEAEAKFKEISEAYDCLSTPEKRTRYDRFGTADEFSWEGFGTGMDDIDDILNRFRGFGTFGGGFGFGMNGGMFRQQQMKPQPIKLKLHVTIEEVYNGATKRIRYKRMVPCSHCDGSGSENGGGTNTCPVCGGRGHILHQERRGFATIQEVVVCDRCHGTGSVIKDPCRQCNGTGREVVSEEIDITIPVGAFDGAMFSMNGQGNYAERNKSLVGDLYIMLSIDEDKKFSIQNQYDLLTTIQVPVLDCITGCNTSVQLFGNKNVPITIPKFTKDQTILAVNGMGMPNGNGRGRLLIEIEQTYPKDLSHSEEKLIEELKKSKNFKNI
jgi:molecular chaperone DnaJ